MMRNPLRALFERRSIGSSRDLWAYLAQGTKSSSGTAVNEATAYNVPVIMTCISLISRTIMTLPVDVYERMTDGRKRVATDHPLARLFDTPNSWQDWPMFVQMMQAHLLLRGNAYAWINWTTSTSDGSMQASEIIPLHPDRVTVEQKADWSLSYTMTRKNGQIVPIPADEILHLRGLSTDGVVGRSPLHDWRDTIGAALATQDYAASFWKRGATPTVALKHTTKLGEAARKNLEESWEKIYGGASGRRVAVLEEGMTLETLTLPSDVSQFLQTRQFTRAELAGSLHVPPHMIGDTEKSTSWGTGIEQQQIGYLTFTIQPWLTVWEHGIARCLILNTRRFYVKFKVEGLLRADSTGRSTFYTKMWGVGALSTNNILALEDMDPIGTEGDIRYVPANYVPLGTPVGAIPAAAKDAADFAAATATITELVASLRKEPAA